MCMILYCTIQWEEGGVVVELRKDGSMIKLICNNIIVLLHGKQHALYNILKAIKNEQLKWHRGKKILFHVEDCY